MGYYVLRLPLLIFQVSLAKLNPVIQWEQYLSEHHKHDQKGLYSYQFRHASLNIEALKERPANRRYFYLNLHLHCTLLQDNQKQISEFSFLLFSLNLA